MLIAKLAIALGALLAVASGVMMVKTTIWIPHSGSGVDVPVLIRFIAMLIFAFGALLVGLGMATLRLPLWGRLAIVVAEAVPCLTVLMVSKESLSTPEICLLIAPPALMAIFAALR